jgi:hypothetical protein
MEKAYKDENEAISKARKKSSDPRLSKLKK